MPSRLCLPVQPAGLRLPRAHHAVHPEPARGGGPMIVSTRPTDFHESLRNLLAFSSKDWGATREDAWIYGIVWGWDTEPDDLEEGEQPDQAMRELAARHGWDDSEVARLRSLHAQFVAGAPLSVERRPSERQTWEYRRIGTDLALHLEVDEQGRVRIHEALVVQMLVDAGWERTA